MWIQKKDQLFAAIFPFHLHNCIDMQMIILRNLNLLSGWEATLKSSLFLRILRHYHLLLVCFQSINQFTKAKQ